MSKLTIVKSMLEYHYALNHKLWKAIELINEGQFLADSQYSHGSIRNHLVHMVQTDIRWMLALQGDPGARKYAIAPNDYPGKSATRALLNDTANKLSEWVNSLDEENMDQTPLYMGGPMWQCLLHIVNHGTDHRAQILNLLDQYGVPTFDQDLITYLWEGE